MLKMKEGQIYPPAPIYKGYGIFKILSTGLADKSRYAKGKAGYYEQIKNRKRLEALGKWFEDLKKQANIKIYEESQEGQKNR
jgi:parvulin-like peptidyl-prolyl isomerase